MVWGWEDNGYQGFYTLFGHLLNNGIAKNSQQRKMFLFIYEIVYSGVVRGFET